jgi:diguanylate cyclase (GGDEF)-like protein
MPASVPSADTSDVALAALLPTSTELLISLEAGAERLAVMALGPRLHDRSYGPPEHELAGTLAFAAAIALKNAQLVEQLHSAATTDELTGLLNRRAMEERLEAETSRALRHQLRTSVVLFDIDRFKLVNDSLGHPAGDRMLVLIADLLRAQCRTLDAVGRFGGDEFLVILPMTSPEESMAFVTRLQQRVAAIELTHPEFGRPTLSLGIAETPKHGSTVSGILAAADAALYRAKRSGRDGIAFADDP